MNDPPCSEKVSIPSSSGLIRAAYVRWFVLCFIFMFQSPLHRGSSVRRAGWRLVPSIKGRFQSPLHRGSSVRLERNKKKLVDEHLGFNPLFIGAHPCGVSVRAAAIGLLAKSFNP